MQKKLIISLFQSVSGSYFMKLPASSVMLTLDIDSSRMLAAASSTNRCHVFLVTLHGTVVAEIRRWIVIVSLSIDEYFLNSCGATRLDKKDYADMPHNFIAGMDGHSWLDHSSGPTCVCTLL
jgi:hypothetical protein